MNKQDYLDIQRLEVLLRDLPYNHEIVYAPVISSTNSLAINLAEEGAKEGTIVLTDSQPGGRGRQGRRWFEVPGNNIAMSIILYPVFPPQFLMMNAAISVVSALREVADIESKIKWPNDIHISGKKVCGILIETRQSIQNNLNLAVAGIGINVNGSLVDIPEIGQIATTVEENTEHRISREKLISSFLHHLDNGYKLLQKNTEKERSIIWKEWRSLLFMLGKEINVHQGEKLIHGLALDVDEDGTLVLQTENNTTTRISWGDISQP